MWLLTDLNLSFSEVLKCGLLLILLKLSINASLFLFLIDYCFIKSASSAFSASSGKIKYDHLVSDQSMAKICSNMFDFKSLHLQLAHHFANATCDLWWPVLVSWGPGADDVSQYLQYCLICSSCQSDLRPCTRTHPHAHTQTHLPHCQSKLGACSLNPIYGTPIVFLDAVSDTGNKGQNSSTHHPGRGGKIYIFIWNWERDRDGRTGQRRRKGWNRLAGIGKR